MKAMKVKKARPPRSGSGKSNKATRFQKGRSGNPAGRPKDSRARMSITEFETAIKKVEGQLKKNLTEHFVEQAFTDNTILIAVMRKRLPDLGAISGEFSFAHSVMSDEEAKALQKEMIKQIEHA